MNNIAKILILANFLILITARGLSADDIGYIAVDDRQWTLLEPLLPSNRDLLLLTPENNGTPSQELLVFERLPEGVGLGSDPLPKDAKMYDMHLTKTDCFLAYEVPSQKSFFVDRTFKMNTRFYRVKYHTPFQNLSIADRKKWIELCRQTSPYTPEEIHSSATQHGWIVVTDEGVYQNGRKLATSDRMQTYTDKKNGFSIEFPASWNFMKDEYKETKSKRDKNSPGFTSYLLFSRKDFLALGGVSVGEGVGGPEYLDEHHWKEQIAFTKKSQKDKVLEAHGDIQSKDGLKGKYIVMRELNNHAINWYAFYAGDNKIYKVELFADQDDIYALKETFEYILTHLCIH